MSPPSTALLMTMSVPPQRCGELAVVGRRPVEDRAQGRLAGGAAIPAAQRAGHAGQRADQRVAGAVVARLLAQARELAAPRVRPRARVDDADHLVAARQLRAEVLVVERLL